MDLIFTGMSVMMLAIKLKIKENAINMFWLTSIIIF